MELKINYSMINILKYKDAILSFFLNIIDLFRLCNCILRSGWGSNSLCKFCKLAGRHDQPDHCASGRTRTYTIPVLETSWLNQLPTLACIHLERLELSLIWYISRNFTNWAKGEFKWNWLESNQWHLALQASALPTELQFQSGVI